MKKVLAILLALSMILGLAACGQNSNTTTTAAPAQSTQAPAQTTQAPANTAADKYPEKAVKIINDYRKKEAAQ